MRANVLLTFAAAVALSGTSTASAHPHVFVEPKLEITATKDGHLQSLRNVWWMDELFSSSVVLDFDANADGKLEKDELAAIGKQVAGSIAEWSFYTFVRKADATVEMVAPPTLNVTFDDKRSELRFDFTMKPKAPLDLRGGDVSFSNFDDTYFVAFDFKGANDFAVRNMAKGCHSDMSAPSPDEAAKSWMATISSIPADATVPADGIKFSQVLSTKFRILCAS
jgi:ABC-type uncharacterized transport system substrate-binding protein